jgi:hypothetical protein
MARSLSLRNENVDIRESVAVLALLTAIPANRLAAAARAELLSQRPALAASSSQRSPGSFWRL